MHKQNFIKMHPFILKVLGKNTLFKKIKGSKSIISEIRLAGQTLMQFGGYNIIPHHFLCGGLFVWWGLKILNKYKVLNSLWGYTAMFLLIRRQYRKFPKYSDTQNICCNHSKIWTMWLYHRVMSPNDADGMGNSVDPDQTAPGSAVFAQAYLSKNLGSLRYMQNRRVKTYSKLSIITLWQLTFSANACTSIM